MKLPKWLKLKPPKQLKIDEYRLFLAGTGVLVLGILSWGALQLDGSISKAEEFQLDLPESSSTISGEMLAFASPESESRGSGDITLGDRPIVTSVSTNSYVVQQGDTLSEIAAENNLDVGTLISFNKIDDVRRLIAGSEITIPDIDGVPYTVQRGDSLDKISARYEVSLENLLDANDLQTAQIQPGQKLFIPGAAISEYDYKKAMGTLFIYPAAGRLTSGFGYRADPFTGVRRMHYGVDFANRTGTPIKATMEGRVVAVGNQARGYGKYVVIKHNHGYQSLYGHLSTIEVSQNQYISQGQRVGLMGNSGRSTGSHLHFSLYKNNVPVDPMGGYLYK
ncbi:MAG: peptidoglycan DD-metalloendopeptidase family protein [Spirochaetia bacterium]